MTWHDEVRICLENRLIDCERERDEARAERDTWKLRAQELLAEAVERDREEPAAIAEGEALIRRAIDATLNEGDGSYKP